MKLDIPHKLYAFFIGTIMPHRQKEKKFELKHLIGLITDPQGTLTAKVHYKRCAHIVSHYAIELDDREVGFNGDLINLADLAERSFVRAAEQGREIAKRQPQ